MTVTSPESHVSPDGLLTLIVEVHDDGDVGIGFAQSKWHTHADLLAEADGQPEDVAVRQFVDRVLADEAPIAVYCLGDKITDAAVLDEGIESVDEDAENELRYLNDDSAPEEYGRDRIVYRLWSGRVLRTITTDDATRALPSAPDKKAGMLDCRIIYYGDITPEKRYVVGVAFERSRRAESSRVLRTLLDGAVTEVVFGTAEGERVIVTGGAAETVVDTRDETAMTVAMTHDDLLYLAEAIEEHEEEDPPNHRLDHPLEPGRAKFLCGIQDLVFETID